MASVVTIGNVNKKLLIKNHRWGEVHWGGGGGGGVGGRAFICFELTEVVIGAVASVVDVSLHAVHFAYLLAVEGPRVQELV